MEISPCRCHEETNKPQSEHNLLLPTSISDSGSHRTHQVHLTTPQCTHIKQDIHSHYRSRAVTPRRNTGCCPELLLSHKSCSSAGSVRSSFLPRPPGSFQTSFLQSSKSLVFCGYHRTLNGFFRPLRPSSTPGVPFHSQIGRPLLQGSALAFSGHVLGPFFVHFTPNLVPEQFRGFSVLPLLQDIGDQRR